MSRDLPIHCDGVLQSADSSQGKLGSTTYYNKPKNAQSNCLYFLQPKKKTKNQSTSKKNVKKI